MFKINKRVFLDYASTTPVDRRVLNVMKPYWSKNFANPSSIHEEGLIAKKAVDDSRQKIARLCQVKTDEVIFCGPGTEADNLAIIGTARAYFKKYQKNFTNKPHIITTMIEHIAVIEACQELEREGFDVTYLRPDQEGIITSEQVKNSLRPETVLVSIIYVSNEIGTIMPIREIAIQIKKYKRNLDRNMEAIPYLHTDASQAVNYFDVNLNKIGADLMILDGSKIYGPKGVSVLIKKHYVPIEKISYGGKQEFNLRPGTENVPLIVGFAKALQIAEEEREKEFKRLEKIQNYFFEQINKEIPQAQINGSKKWRSPSNVNICIKSLNSEFAIIQMDTEGIACSAMTACNSLSGNFESYTISSFNPECASSSLRFSMGRETKKSDIDKTIKGLKKVLNLQGI